MSSCSPALKDSELGKEEFMDRLYHHQIASKLPLARKFFHGFLPYFPPISSPQGLADPSPPGAVSPGLSPRPLCHLLVCGAGQVSKRFGPH